MDINDIYQYFLSCSGVTTDSRHIPENSLFFALKGNHFNGNFFAEEAIRKGARYAIVDERKYAKDDRYILVENVLSTLQKLATWHRDKMNIKIIGITGSNGKTTTKEIIYHVLKKNYKTIATEKNYNNHIGVPLTLLKINETHHFGVIEMGANHPGEIRWLCHIAKPNFGLITNIGKAHLEGFGSYEGVISTKKEIYDYICQNEGTIFYNADNPLLAKLLTDHPDCHKLSYGTTRNAYCHGKIISANPYLSIQIHGFPLIHTGLVGSYNFENLLAGICMGKYFHVEQQQVIEALAQYEPANNRSQIMHKHGHEIILDAYNANPTSMKAAIENFHTLQRDCKALILGDMFELGEHSDQEHKKIIELVHALAFKHVFFVGQKFFLHAGNQHIAYQTTRDFLAWLKNNPLEPCTILIKGSRGMTLEKVVDYL
jgi:UDP-N-acetylmuramoyl-tripeptide--D-alanyl-D-alanine ligase